MGLWRERRIAANVRPEIAKLNQHPLSEAEEVAAQKPRTNGVAFHSEQWGVNFTHVKTNLEIGGEQAPWTLGQTSGLRRSRTQHRGTCR